MDLVRHKIRIRRYPLELAKWKGYCLCGKQFQFHFFGATLGFGLEHLRRSHGVAR